MLCVVPAVCQIQSGSAYTLVNQRTGLALDDPGGSSAAGTQIQQWACNGLSQQNWIFSDVGGGVFTITNQLGGVDLTVYNADPSNGTPILGWTPQGQQQENWVPTQVGSNTYVFSNQRTGTAMEVANGALSNGSPVKTWSNNGQQQQVWALVPAGSCHSGGFNVLIDTAQMNRDEAVQIGPLAMDGVWANVTTSCDGCGTKGTPIDKSDAIWSQVFQALNGSAITVSEESYGDYTNYSWAYQYSGSSLSAAMVNIERNDSADNTVLTPSEIDSAAAAINNRVIVNSRSYAEGDPRATAVQQALTDPNCYGVSFEVTFGNATGQNFIQGIQDTLDAGRKVFLLIPPQPYGNYAADIQNVVSGYFAGSMQISNPNLYIVLALYRRDADGMGVGFLQPDSGPDGNSVLAAQQWLASFRMSSFGR